MREGDWAVIRIQDTGIGMPPELLATAFDLFVQGERSLARTEGGLGVGLTIVRQLVTLHGGSVTARSEGIGKGSEFIVLLPLLPRESLSTIALPDTSATASDGKRRVLVVDDNRDSADMLEALLTMFGHDVHTAYDGPSALAAATKYGPDVVLLDIGLPGMNGYDVAERLRNSPRFRRTTLIAFTGYGQEEDRQRARDAGFDDYLVKPVDPTTLAKIIAATPVASLQRNSAEPLAPSVIRIATGTLAAMGGVSVFQSRRVLVVDDQDNVRQVIVDQLAVIGIDARTARNGREALQICEATCDFDLVLADVVMPEIGGVELARRLKDLCPDLPVVLMTGHESQVDGVIDAGAVTLIKPFSLLSLEQIIEEALTDRSK